MALSEFRLIELLRGIGDGRADVCLGIGDDAALLRVPDGQRLVVCADAIVEGVHFPAGADAADIGWRALAVNLSDMAAMGARPRWATMTLTLPEADERWLQPFAKGFKALADMHAVALVGGDTVRGPLNVGVQVMGTLADGQGLLRSGAQPGDGVWVSGCLGDAAAGLEFASGNRAVNNDAERELCNRFLRPVPRVEFGSSLHGLATAAIDISDGLMQDAQHIAFASGVNIALDAGSLPLSNALTGVFEPSEALRLALSGGDDYELLFTLPAARERELQALLASHGLRCTRIGTVNKGENVTCALEGKPWMPSYTGFDHFGTRRPE